MPKQDAKKTVFTPEKPQPTIIESSPYDAITSESLFTPEECAEVLAAFEDTEWEFGNTAAGFDSDDAVDNPGWRNSNVKFLQPADVGKVKVFDRLLAGMVAANNHFQFDVDQFAAVQLARYDVGGFYDWHVDIGPGYMGNRKLSMTVQLSAPEDYDGGDLVVDAEQTQPITMSRAIGSATVFPSFVRHKVTQVTRGTRYSLVVWAAGNQRFR